MPSTTASGDAERAQDLYMLLNIDRSADVKEVRAAYLRLALCLHPDKAVRSARHAISQQQDEGGPVLESGSVEASLRRVRQRADQQFVRVERAYRVLSDPVKRLIYDEYGREGLKAFELKEMAKQTVGPALKHPAEVRQVLDQLLRDAAQRRLDPTLGTYGGIVAECKCLPWIGADGRLIARNIFPDVTRLVVRQAIKVPLTDKTHVTCGGYALHHGGIGAGSVFLSAQHDVSPTHWVGSVVELGHQTKVSCSCGTNNSDSSNSAPRSLQAHFTLDPERGLGYRLSTTERVDPLTTLEMSWGVGGENTANLNLARTVQGGRGSVSAEVFMGGREWDDLGLRLSYNRIASLTRRLHLSGKVGVRGMEVEVDSRRFLPKQVKMKTALRLSERGVMFVLGLQRGSMLFELPVLLSTIFTGWTLTAGGLIPAVADAAVGWLLSSAWQRRSARQQAEREPVVRRRMARAVKDAANQARLMAHMAARSKAEEEEKGAGLVIVCARYGSQLSANCGSHWWSRSPTDPPAANGSSTAAAAAAPISPTGEGNGSQAIPRVCAPNVDVAVPLQFFVKDSTLTLPPGSKSSLLGFYTPSSCRPPRPFGSGSFLQERHRDIWDHVGPNAEWDSGSLLRQGIGMNGWPSLPEAQLYIRYEFAGRTFEDTFQDMVEVVIPSPTATYRSGLEAR
ncbi:unnamed protein product [Ascophyllum nodosum]